MADDKRTQLGSAGPVRPATDPEPVAPHAAQTSYLPPQEDPLIGQTLIGRYFIQRKLGEGGMGAVYLATHQLLEKQIALKVLHGEFARKPDLVERFMQEAKAASRIRHENVIDISDFGSTPEGLVFFAMELLHGHDLHQEVARARLAQQLLPWERSKKIFLQICAALSAAHGHGIVHRDLKPENVYLVDFLGDPDFVKLLDFGIAKLTEVSDEGARKLTKTGMLFGTPEYMSPEQARGEQVDHRVDIYAMGCILFQLVTGRVPFEAENFMGILSLHLTEPPPAIPLEVFDAIGAPRALGQVIDTALAKDRNQRFATIDDFANAVRAVCGDAPVIPTKPGSGRTQRPTGPANIPAPSITTERSTPTPPPGGSLVSTQNRVRTQWTGNLAVPTEEVDAPPKQKGKGAYLIAGGIVAAGAVVAIVIAMTRGGSSTPAAPPPPPGAGSQLATAPSVDAGAAIAPEAPPLPPLPAKVELRLDSSPKGAKVTDLTTGVVYKTPYKISRAGSRTPVQYKFTLRGHSDAVVELVPDREKIEHVEKMEKGVSGTPAVRKLEGSGSSVKPPDPPDPGSAAKPPEPPPKPPDPPKHDPACDEIPPPAHCLKDPTRGS